MESFKTTSALGLLLLAFLASLSNASLLSENPVEFKAELRLLENATDAAIVNATDVLLENTTVVEIEDHEDEEGDHDGEEGDHDGEEGDHEEHDHELTEAEIQALQGSCACMESTIYCSSVEGLEHCRCEGGKPTCGKDEVHDDHDDRDDHDDHGDDHGDDHDDHGHSQLESEFEDHVDEAKPWGVVIGMSLVVNLTTFIGVFLIAGHWGRNILCRNWKPDPATGSLWANVIIPMFACGALLATALFLMLPEALHLIESEFGIEDNHRRLAEGHDDHEDEGDEGGEAATTWRWGASIMGGFLFPVILRAFFPHGDLHGHVNAPMVAAEAAEDDDDDEKDAPTVAVPTDNVEKSSRELKKSEDEEYVNCCGCIRLKNVPLFVSINLGEALHNFTDGMFIGAAYIGCGTPFGNSVVLVSVLHELPNQLAGYLVMVNQNGIDPIVALFINFLFGLSTLVGALVVLVLDLGNLAMGCIFGIGGGIFLHVAIQEMLSTAEHHAHGARHVAYMLLAFFIGSVVIGLVLLNHEHCDSGH